MTSSPISPWKIDGDKVKQFIDFNFLASCPIISWQIDGDTMETVTDFIFLGSKKIMAATIKLKDTSSLIEKL